jgi:LPXTG-motif cell wall-anchored protein
MRLRQLVGAVAIAAGLLTMGMAGTAQATGNPPPNTNEVAFWCGSSDLGVKFDGLTSSTFTVPPPPTGKVWTLLVLKAGSDQSTDGENETFPNPVVGQTYAHSSGKTLSHAILCFGPEPTTTTAPSTTSPSTTLATTTTAGTTTTSTTIATTTTGVNISLFGVGTFAFCGEDNLPHISITFGNRPDLTGLTGTLFFSDGTSVPLLFTSGATVTIAYPASHTTPLVLVYLLNGEVATATVTLPADCPLVTTTTTVPPTTTTAPTTTLVTTTLPTTTIATTTTLPTTTIATTTTVPTTTGSTTSTTLCLPCFPTTSPPGTTGTTLATTTVATTAPTTTKAPTTTLAPVTTVVATSPPTTTTLPVTGGDPSLMILIGLGMTAGGGVLVFTGRRRVLA